MLRAFLLRVLDQGVAGIAGGVGTHGIDPQRIAPHDKVINIGVVVGCEQFVGEIGIDRCDLQIYQMRNG